ncbi:hypothetical protein KKC88_02830 [Patescibacteria group bacterium]|nr:hypothetical protein [Patescibacteria group bacterium]MBU1672906.1 hypothetical protein [Patescibacteria group bacterium]MBU1963157.1 hypothetical protein [Patescibacteria group bacterium]
MIIFRILISILILFELLNFFKILNFELEFTWLGLVITSCVTWLIIELLNSWFRKITKKQLPLWGLLIIIVLLYLDALADMFHFYSAFSWYDQFLHFASGIAIAANLLYVFWELQKAKVFKMGLVGTTTLTLCVSVMFGVLYEWEEYFEDLIFGSNRLGDGRDTANDLMLCFLGGIIVFAAVNLFYKYKLKKQ